jgi:hypothetical protein
MADKNMNLKIPGQSIAYIVLCVIGLSILLLGGIVPASRAIDGLNEDIALMKSRIEKQKVLVPMAASLRKQLTDKKPDILPLPVEGKLSPSQLNTLPAVFRTAAKASGMKLLSALPNVNALAGNAQVITVDVNLRGDFSAFRKFLLHVGGMPYVHHVEEIEVQADPKNRDYKVKIQVSIG